MFDGSAHRSKELGLLQIKRLLKQAKECGAVSLNFTGGEPFIRKDIYRIIAYCSDLGLPLGINTRHTFALNDISQLESSFFGRFFVSIDSHETETAEKLAGRTDFFAKYISGIRLLIKNGIPTSSISVINKLNVSKIDNLLEFLCGLGMTSVYLRGMDLSSACVGEYNRGDKKKRHELLLSNSDEEFVKEKELKWRNNFHRLEGFIEDRGASTASKMLHPRCDTLKGEIHARPDGKVFYCALAHDLVIGDLKKQSFKSFLDSPLLAKLARPSRQDFKGTECFRCTLFDRCTILGRCYKRILRMHGKFFMPDDKFCRRFSEERLVPTDEDQ